MNVLIKFKKLNQICIKNIMRDKLGYHLNRFEMAACRDNFLFSSDDFLHRVAGSCSGTINLEIEVNRLAHKIGEDYGYVVEEIVEYDGLLSRFIIELKGEDDSFRRETLNPFVGGFSVDRSFGGSMTCDSEPVRRYFEEDRNALLEAMKRLPRIPKTFDVYSGYSKDGRLRTVVHWEDGEKTSVYLKEDDFDDIYLAIAYCYVKRKFGNLSRFKRIVERNTKYVTPNVKRFKYGGELVTAVNMYNIYDQVALYLAISYLGDTDQWLTDEDIKRLEDSVNE